MTPLRMTAGNSTMRPKLFMSMITASNSSGPPGAELGLEVFQLLEFDRFLFCIGGDALGGGDVLGDGGEVLRGGTDGLDLAAGSALGGQLPQDAVDDQVRIAADGAGEMGVVGLREAVMAFGFDLVGGAFEALEEGELEGVFLGQAADFCEEALDLDAIGEIAGREAVADRQFAEFLEAVGIGIFVDAVDRGEEAVLDLAGRRLRWRRA